MFRYRGYIYDSDTGLYYLQSRYYDPQTGRFINPDGIINANGGVLGNNLYAYCNNNPINFVDPTGRIIQWIILGVVVVVAILALPSCAKTMLESTAYDTYEEALEAANQSVYSSGQAHVGQIDQKGRYAEYGVEYKSDIYYNTDDEKFYITRAYTSNLIDEVKHRKVMSVPVGYEMIGYTHYHPSTKPISLTFSEADLTHADYYDIAAHIINAKSETNGLYQYIPKWKRELINR